MACPGSLKMQEGMPDDHNENSDRGTACHAVSAECLLAERHPAERIEEQIPVHDAYNPDEEPRSVTFTDELADLCLVYVENIRALARNAAAMYVEQRVEFTDFVVDLDLEETLDDEHKLEPQFGTADVVLIQPLVDGAFELQVHDAKFGFRPVDVTRNKQLMTYALACLRKFELAYDITCIRIFIHQPRLYAEPTEWACTVEELLAFGENELKPAVQLAEEANRAHGTIPLAEWQALYLNPKPNANDCAYCKAMATCPAYAIEVAKTVSMSAMSANDFPMGDTAPVNTRNFATRDVDAFTVAQELTYMMSRVDDIEAWCLSARAEMERRLLAELNAPHIIDAFGYKIVRGRQGPRKWKDPAATEEYLRKSVRLRIDQVFNLKIKSPTQVEDQLTKAKKGSSELPLLSAKQWGALQGNIARSDAKLSVAKASDKRPPAEIKPPSEGDFPFDTLEDIQQTEGIRFGDST